eukprot:Hpha_TRINITY_DN14401_c0_g1::TRINITY_DN14401_c0_g1_i1::g.157464::m.157464
MGAKRSVVIVAIVLSVSFVFSSLRVPNNARLAGDSDRPRGTEGDGGAPTPSGRVARPAATPSPKHPLNIPYKWPTPKPAPWRGPQPLPLKSDGTDPFFYTEKMRLSISAALSVEDPDADVGEKDHNPPNNPDAWPGFRWTPEPLPSYADTLNEQVAAVTPEEFGASPSLPSCYNNIMSLAGAKKCPLEPGMYPARVAFDKCTKLDFTGCIDGRGARTPCLYAREHGYPDCKWAGKGKKKKPRNCITEQRPADGVWLYHSGVQLATNSYGASWIAAKSVFAKTPFISKKPYFGRDTQLEGPTFAMQTNAHINTYKSEPATAFWVWHVGWINLYLRRFGCKPPQPPEKTSPLWEWCREQVRRVVSLAENFPPARVPPKAAVPPGAVKVIMPFFWDRKSCNVDGRTAVDSVCYTSGQSIDAEDLLRIMRASVRRHTEIYGEGSVVMTVCDEHTRDAVVGAKTLVSEVAVLNCSSRGPQSDPSLRGGLALPWLSLEYGQASLPRWPRATHIVWAESDQMVDAPLPSALLQAATAEPARVIIPHRFEQYHTSPLKIGTKFHSPGVARIRRQYCQSGHVGCAPVAPPRWMVMYGMHMLLSTAGGIISNCTDGSTGLITEAIGSDVVTEIIND